MGISETLLWARQKSMIRKPDSLAEKSAPRLNWSSLGLSPNIFLPLAVFVIMFAIFSIFANNFFTVRSVLNLLVQTSTFTILGIGATLVLVVGCIDFSLGAVIAFSGTAVFVFAAMGIPIWIAMIAASILGGVIGLVNGFLVARVRLPSFITTFAMAMLIYGLLAAAFGAFMAAHAGPIPHPDNLEHLGDLANNPAFRIVSHDASGAEIVVFPGISWIVVITVVVAVLSHLFLEKIRFGRYAYLVGSNSEASRFSGIKVARIKTLAFVFASVLAGLVGVLLASRLGNPPGAAAGYEMIAIECAMIGGASLSGGTGSVGRTVIGAFLISTLAMGITMMNVDKIYIPMFLNGLIVLGVVYLNQKRNRE
jgi:ribose transport system permease protein